MNALDNNHAQTSASRRAVWPTGQTTEAIRGQYAARVTQLQCAAHQAHLCGDAGQAIRMMIDLVCTESMMLNELAFVCDQSPQQLANDSVIRRADIEVLMACAIEVDDSDAKLLAQLLLQNHQPGCAAAVAKGALLTR